MKSTLSYLGRSEVQRLTDGLSLSLKPNLARDKVFFDGQVENPLRWREAMSALHEVVVGDLRFKKRTGTDAYRAYLKEVQEDEAGMQREAGLQARAELLSDDIGPAPRGLKRDFEKARRKYWKIRDEWGFELRRNDPELFRALVPWDPIVTVAPDVVLFEGFSKDESSYGCLTVDREGFSAGAAEGLGTTNVDFSMALFEQIQTFRTYKKTRLIVDPTGFEVQVEGREDHREAKIDLPPAWLRGFGQLQAATTLPSETVHLDVPTVYAILSFLKRHREKSGPRSIRFDLVPGQAPKLVLEPWGHVITAAGKFEGSRPQSIRMWGRRRLMVLARLLPLAESVQVRLLGSGMPSMWTVRMGEMRFMLGLSGWTKSDWTNAAALDLLSGRGEAPPQITAKIEALLKKNRSMKTNELARAALASTAQTQAALFELARLGQVIYDFGRDTCRYRPVLPVPLGADIVGPEHEEHSGARKILAAKSIRVLSEEEIGRLRIIVADIDGTKRVELGVDADGVIRKGRCDCSFFYRNKLRQGPCRHILALRMSGMGQGAAS